MNLSESIKVLTNEIAYILSNNQPSIYLFGSILLDDYKPDWSDNKMFSIIENSVL